MDEEKSKHWNDFTASHSLFDPLENNSVGCGSWDKSEKEKHSLCFGDQMQL